jgi:hypothetical protein
MECIVMKFAAECCVCEFLYTAGMDACTSEKQGDGSSGGVFDAAFGGSDETGDLRW